MVSRITEGILLSALAISVIILVTRKVPGALAEDYYKPQRTLLWLFY